MVFYYFSAHNKQYETPQDYNFSYKYNFSLHLLFIHKKFKICNITRFLITHICCCTLIFIYLYNYNKFLTLMCFRSHTKIQCPEKYKSKSENHGCYWWS